MLCRLHTVYKIIHCAALHTLCDITQRVSNHYTVKWQFFAFNLEKITLGRQFLHRHRLWCLWLISGMFVQWWFCCYLINWIFLSNSLRVTDRLEFSYTHAQSDQSLCAISLCKNCLNADGRRPLDVFTHRHVDSRDHQILAIIEKVPQHNFCSA